MNFVEIMALCRAFWGGCFRCSGISPKIIVAELLAEGYDLKIRKSEAKIFCLNCITAFCTTNKLRVTEDQGYLTIHSP